MRRLDSFGGLIQIFRRESSTFSHGSLPGELRLLSFLRWHLKLWRILNCHWDQLHPDPVHVGITLLYRPKNNSSDSWDILWYNTRKRCITSMRLNVITYTSGLLTSWLFPSISFLTLCSSQSIWDCMLFSTCLVSLGSESASCSWTAVALQRKSKRNRFETLRLLLKSISGQWSSKFSICFKNTARCRIVL